MKKSVNIAFIGGDNRAAHAAGYLCALGYEVGYCGCKSDMHPQAVKIERVGDALDFADAVILPIPVSRDDKTVSYSGGVLLSQITNALPRRKKISFFGGIVPKSFKNELEILGHGVFDYAECENYLQVSATLTADAFFDFIKDKNFGVLENQTAAVCGLGRIGKRLVSALAGQNTQINVLSSKTAEQVGLYPENVRFFSYDQAKDALFGCSVVINTAPANVIGIQAVKALPENGVFYELASAPFGIDGECAKYLGARYQKALGLPGIYYPKESGELIAKSVLEQLGALSV